MLAPAMAMAMLLWGFPVVVGLCGCRQWQFLDKEIRPDCVRLLKALQERLGGRLRRSMKWARPERDIEKTIDIFHEVTLCDVKGDDG